MSKISEHKEKRIKEEILRLLYENYPKLMYTVEIADELIRDDEFILKLMKYLNKANLATIFEENMGRKVKRKWGLNKDAYKEYKKLIS